MFIFSAEAAVAETATDKVEIKEELLAVVAVAVVIVVAAVVVVFTGMMEVSWPISRSSLKVDHWELIDEDEELRRIVCLKEAWYVWRIGRPFCRIRRMMALVR